MSPAGRLVIDPARIDREAIARAAAVLARGGLVAFPTETVYGLGANALDAAAVGRIFAAKGRPADDPLIVHLARVDDLAAVAAAIPALVAPLAARFWPGPLTMVLPRGPAVPMAVTAGRQTVAVRVPRHPVAQALIAAAGCPVAAPSANRFGRTSPTTAEHVWADLGDRIDLLVDGGPAEVGVESTVLDLSGERARILRPGGVTREALRAVLGSDGLADADAAPLLDDPRSPGTALRHYAPRAEMILLDGPDDATAPALISRAADLAASGRTVGVLAYDEDLARLGECTPIDLGSEADGPANVGGLVRLAGGGRRVALLGRRDRPEIVAGRLYAAMRALDAAGVDAIVARMPDDAGLGAALRDRLRRAASGRVETVVGAAADRSRD